MPVQIVMMNWIWISGPLAYDAGSWPWVVHISYAQKECVCLEARLTEPEGFKVSIVEEGEK